MYVCMYVYLSELSRAQLTRYEVEQFQNKIMRGKSSTRTPSQAAFLTLSQGLARCTG